MKLMKKSLLALASLGIASSLLAGCEVSFADLKNALNTATAEPQNVDTSDESETKVFSDDFYQKLLAYNDQADENPDDNIFPENIVVLKAPKLTNQQKEYIKQYYLDDGVGQTVTDAYNRPVEAVHGVNWEEVYNHSSKVTERPQFASNLHVAGEYKDGVFDEEKETWYSPSKAKSNNQILQLKGYRGYLYNKSHLIAWSLGGSMESDNLILGTRSQNVGTNASPDAGGMSYLETKVRNAIYDDHDVEVLYHAVPVYKDKEIVPRGVYVRAYSMNDEGKTLNEAVYVLNIQQGVTINYNDGTFKVNDSLK